MPNLRKAPGSGHWLFGGWKRMTAASRGLIGPANNEYNRAYYNSMTALRKGFNYFPNLNKYKYIYRGFKTRVPIGKGPTTMKNILLRRNPETIWKNITFKNINGNVGWSSWSLSPNTARSFGKLVLRMPTSLLKNVRVGNMSRTGEQELILPPMKLVFNKNSNSNTVNVTNIKVNASYVRNGSNTKTYIPRTFARRLS